MSLGTLRRFKLSPLPQLTVEGFGALTKTRFKNINQKEKAISASKYVHFNKPDKPNALIAMLKDQGLSRTQVFTLIRKYPSIVHLDSQKNLLPKIEFFRSRGISKSDLPSVLLGAHPILSHSMKEIQLSLDLLRSIIDNDENTAMAIKRCPRILLYVPRIVAPNVEILRQAGMPEARIRTFLTVWPSKILQAPGRYQELVNKVVEMGIDPGKSAFFVGIISMISMNKFTWEKKMEVYKRWGCSEDVVMKAFKTYPWCMLASVGKIEAIMDFLVNQMGWRSFLLMKFPQVLTLSLNRRIIPRCSVYQVLISKGLIEEPSSLWGMLKIAEKKFIEKYVKSFEGETPELLKLYQEKLKQPTLSLNSTTS